jgi:hypothetical protein
MSMVSMRRALGAAGLLLPVLGASPARADFHIFSPYEIDLGELEIEHNGDATFDRIAGKDSAQSYTLELGTGLTSWWHSEVELGFDRDPGAAQATRLTAVVTENMIQFTEPGEDWADWGVYFEYGQNTGREGPNEFTIGPVVGKDIGRFGNILNLFVTRQLGPNQDSHGLDVSYAWQTKWRVWEPLSPAVEIYGDMGSLTHTPSFNRQEFLAGPVALGTMPLQDMGLGRSGRFKYEVGWLFGGTGATSSGTLRWRLELEIPF